jgi:hypothetical protein
MKKHLTVLLLASVATLASAEKYYAYGKDPATLTIFHVVQCKLDIRTSASSQFSFAATVFSRASNEVVARGCWRIGDDAMMHLKMQNGQEMTFNALLDLRYGERF